MDLQPHSRPVLFQYSGRKKNWRLSTEVNLDAVSAVLSSHLTFDLQRMEIREVVPTCQIYRVWEDPCKRPEDLGRLVRYHGDCEKKSMASSILREYSLNKQKRLFFRLSLTQPHCPSDCLPIFSVKPLHLFQRGVSKKVKACTIAYLTSSDSRMPIAAYSEKVGKERSCGRQILRGANNSLASFKTKLYVKSLQTDFGPS